MAKVYATINLERPSSYWDYENQTNFSWGKQDNYEIVKKIGRGRYSDVFEGVDVSQSNRRIVIKVLKPVHKRKIKREVKILQNLRGGTNIIELLDVVRDAGSMTPAIVFELVDSTDFRSLSATFSDYDIRYYMYQLLRATDYCHSQGIMHRDIKPHNIMVDHKLRMLKLIDWGLAEFYKPDTAYNVRVATRFYKGPELLVGNEYYDYSLDIWSFGVMFAAMVFKKDPLFHGTSNTDQLVKIARVLGTQKLYQYLEKYNLQLGPEYDDFGDYSVRPWDRFVNDDNMHLTSPELFDLLDHTIIYDHAMRYSAQECMDHRYFDAVRQDALSNNSGSSSSYS